MDHKPAAWASGWITLVFGTSAVAAALVGVMLIAGREDTEAVESPLLLSIARQLLAGPWELYGPFGARNPLVLIHAPLYYHAAALAAWPLALLGLDPISAARLAGRLLSTAGLVLTALAAYRLARLDGEPARAGSWAVCLVATAPAIGVMPYCVRPDMLGVAFQSIGVLLVARRLHAGLSGLGGLPAAFAAFGLAACTKQHDIVAAVLSTAVLLAAWRRGRIAGSSIASAVLLGSAIVGALYGAEELVTGGQMSQAVFVAAAATSRVHPGNWMRACIVVSAIAGRSKGLIALVSAAGLVAIAARRGLLWRLVVAAGLALILFIVGLSVLEIAGTIGERAIVSFLAVWLSLAIVIPACAVAERRFLIGGGLDRFLLILLAGELVMVILMSRASTGAWINYGIQAVVWAGILAARALHRACQSAERRRMLWPIALASLLVPAAGFRDGYVTVIGRQRERAAIDQLVATCGCPGSEIYFAASPGLNRVYGRPELVFDDWLYPVFESVNLAQPRSTWLGQALKFSPIRFVITPSAAPDVDGLGQSLTDLGYLPLGRVDDFFIWERSRPVRIVDSGFR